jgi:hypothetical protein
VTCLGGTPVSPADLPLGPATPATDFGGVLLPWEFHAVNSNDWAEYWTTCDLYVRPLLLVMNQQKWDGLPAAVQEAFTENSGVEASLEYLAEDAKYNYDNTLLPALPDRGYDYLAVKGRARTVGHPIYILDDAERAEWRQAVRPLWDKWLLRYASVLPTTFVLDRALELIEQYSAD